eukprot:4459753-Amphidinium_carterae.1
MLPSRVCQSSAGFDATTPSRSFFTRILVCVGAIIELPGFVTVPAISKQLPIDSARGRLPRAW